MNAYIDSTFCLLMALGFSIFGCGSSVQPRAPDIQLDALELRNTVSEILDTPNPRNYLNIQSLDQTSEYIYRRLAASGYAPEYQDYAIEKFRFRNVIASIGPRDAPRWILGAHYDVCGDQPGADDNASGIAGLLHIARLLKVHEHELRDRVDFVAYTLEEPPLFRSQFMGSYIHAKSMYDHRVPIRGMIALEMIGYYSNEPDSQEYPVGLLGWFYPSLGNYIGVVSNISSLSLALRFKNYMRLAPIEVHSLAAPAIVPGVDFSDHLNYWEFGYPAIMITDTAFFRNKNYHQATDTIDTLDFDTMKEAVRGVYFAILNLATQE